MRQGEYPKKGSVDWSCHVHVVSPQICYPWHLTCFFFLKKTFLIAFAIFLPSSAALHLKLGLIVRPEQEVALAVFAIELGTGTVQFM